MLDVHYLRLLYKLRCGPRPCSKSMFASIDTLIHNSHNSPTCCCKNASIKMKPGRLFYVRSIKPWSKSGAHRFVVNFVMSPLSWASWTVIVVINFTFRQHFSICHIWFIYSWVHSENRSMYYAHCSRHRYLAADAGSTLLTNAERKTTWTHLLFF